jgi:hypothetical protein
MRNFEISPQSSSSTRAADMIPSGMAQMAIDMRRRMFIAAVGRAPAIAIALAFTAAFTMRGAAQDFMAPSGTPAEAFPKPERPVADIISPIWHSEKERDAAGEARQLVRLLGMMIRSTPLVLRHSKRVG